jgi:general bacterial porin, GBP family
MKKHLIAAAVAGALAVPAMAQVSVYGVIETGVVNTKEDGSDATTKLDSNFVNSSRLGFKGSEDLGGGMKAFFRLEQSLDIESGSLGGQTSSAAGQFNRGAEVGLSGGFGSIKLGKFDITSAEGIDSSFSQFGNVGNFSGVDIGSDINHAIQYATPKVAGFSIQVGHALEDGSVNDTTSFYVGGDVSGVKLAVGYTLDDNGAGVKRKATTAGASVNLGVATVGVAYGKNDGDTLDVTNTIISAKAPVSGATAFHAVYGTFETKNAAGATTDDTKKWALGLSNSLSKRTAAYAAYQSTDDDGVDENVIYLGVKHKF